MLCSTCTCRIRNTYNYIYKSVYKVCYMCLLCVRFGICVLTQAFSMFAILYIYVDKCMILRQVFNVGKVFLSLAKVICNHNFKTIQ